MAFLNSLLFSNTGTGKLVAFIVLPSILIYGLMFFFVYRRCKYAQRVRRNLAATGHTPEDIRMAMATMVDQASRRPLTSTAAARNRHENNADVTQILIEHMDASRDRRLGQDGEGDGRHQGRIGQPTLHHYSGDRSTSPLPPPILAVQADLDLYGSRQGSLNSFPVDNCQPDGQHPQHQRGIEDDPHSYGSGRSQGHRTPSPRPHSPYSLDRRREDSTHLAYFGLAERDGDVHPPAVSPSAPSYYDVVHPRQGGAQPPPPSYEEAATGKYNP
ncbi:hypothetical protein PoB_001770500 [Plakobranchus ocellatus]|uniref:Uncharacterized protein n=1 Tax=Plakobranchus ocellatus TaxID=259542 RepID=A0AAV3Z7R9_9GAST|nr:hypothetical protein PoB_001770500 [Plakobranchus ocellatus]